MDSLETHLQPITVTKPLLRGITHVVAAVAVVPAGIVLWAQTNRAASRWAVAIYLVCLLAMFGVSALYHRGHWKPSTARIMQKLDHSTIFLAIAGSTTPFAVLALHDWARPTLLVTVWGVTLFGIGLEWAPGHVPRWMFTGVYVVAGWSTAIVMPQLYRGVGPVAFGLILAGGVAYTLGAVVYATRWPRLSPRVFGFHEVFHAWTIVAAAMHYAAVTLVVRRYG